MNVVFFDIETNALTDWSRKSDLTTLHCIGIRLPNGEIKVARSSHPNEIENAIKVMNNADAVCGHNAIHFDVPALKKLRPDFSPKKVYDTKVIASCVYPDLKVNDYQTFIRNGLPEKLAGSHSLKAWGYRIGEHKDSHGETEDWTKLSDEMVEYCRQDVQVTTRLYMFLMRIPPSPVMLRLEHKFAELMQQQEFNGWPFDTVKAEILTSELMQKREQLNRELKKTFAPTIVPMGSHVWVGPDGKHYNTKRELLDKGVKAKDITKGPKKVKTIPFNPASRDQICARLLDDGWKPTAFEGKRPAINEGVLKEIGTEKALKLCEYLMIVKRLGQLAEGNQAWLSLVKNGRIHGHVVTNGAVSGRCTHRNPNVAQVPSVRAEYGKECRELFTAPRGKVLVGCDASGIELRCLAHYLARFDQGEYAKIIVSGDIHTVNQHAAGLDTRDQAKTFIYAFLYGAGDAKIGQIVGGTQRDGRRLKEQFQRKIPAIGKLLKSISDSLKVRSRLIGLDGRHLPTRSEHSALNLLLQSAGAVIMKQSLVNFSEMDLPDYELHGNIHDEVQFSCSRDNAEELGKAFVSAIRKAGTDLKLRCPLDGEYNVGNNWAETH